MMIAKTKILSAAKDFAKSWRFGKTDVIESLHTLPHGVDSKPNKGDTGVVADTTNNESTVVVGYIKKFEQTSEGETRIYATDADGNEVCDIFLKNNGIIEIFGNNDNLVRYSELKAGFDQLKADFNTLVATFNAHVHAVPLATALAVPPAVGGTSPTATSGTPSVADISASKVDEVKIN